MILEYKLGLDIINDLKSEEKFDIVKLDKTVN